MVSPPKRLLIVEGGGQRNQALQAECRRAFCRLQQSAGLHGRLARVVPAGGRRAAYELFCAELGTATPADRVVLLVDAEDAVTTKDRWAHVRSRSGDGWEKPATATDAHLHFMAVTMETWLLAEPTGLAKVFGKAFKPAAVPKWPDLEQVPKVVVNATITKATGGYDKGQHSFRALAEVSAPALEASCPSAKALFDHLRS